MSDASTVLPNSALSGRNLTPATVCSSSAVMSDTSVERPHTAPSGTSLAAVAAGTTSSLPMIDISTGSTNNDGMSLSLGQNAGGLSGVRMMLSNNVKIGDRQFKRQYDKKQFCPFCNNSVAKLPRHMESRHIVEPEVEEISKLPLKSAERKRLLEKLLRRGNYKHNVEVLRSNEGVIVPARRSAVEKSSEYFVPCEYCFAFCLQRDLWKHVKVCKHKPSDDGIRRRHRSRGAMLLPSADSASSGLKEGVFARMNNGPEAILIRNDALLVSYGNNLFFQHGHASHRHQYISQKLRQLARFMLAVRKMDNSILRLADCINPSKFAVVIQAVQVVSGFDEQTHLYKIPSMPLKLGHSLHDCANIRIAEALQKSDVAQQDIAANFVRLYQTQWAKQISSHALRTMTVRKMNQIQMLPLAEDLQKLQSFLKESAENLVDKFKTQPCLNDWSQLARVTLTQIVLFNRRRSGETQRLLCENYRSRNRNVNEDVARGLSVLERKLLDKFVKVTVMGKKGRPVPILLTAVLQNQVDVLMDSRAVFGIRETNPYVFAQCGSDDPARSSDCLRTFAISCGASKPALLTSTKLRKHVATMSQIMNLKRNELDILASFLGHDILVHRNYYRLPQDSLEMAKVSKILLAMENGNVDKFKGKSLDEICLSSGKNRQIFCVVSTCQLLLSKAVVV